MLSQSEKKVEVMVLKSTGNVSPHFELGTCRTVSFPHVYLSHWPSACSTLPTVT
jgi:hypothetical protein